MRYQVKKAIYVAITAVLFSGSAIADDSSSTTTTAKTYTGGTVNFTGDITSAACAVSSDSADQTVDLGEWTANSFGSAGATSNKKPFNITLEQCDTSSVSTATIAFTGDADSTNTTALGLSDSTNDTNATGIAIQILAPTGSTMSINGSGYAYTLTSDTTQNITFYGQYISTGASVTAGTADGTATFTITYS